MNRNELTKIIKESIVSYFYESLNTQKQKYGDELVNKLLSLDPSKTYKYIEQICNYYNQNIPEDEIKKYIDLYDTKLTKHLIPKEDGDIGKIKTFKDLKDIIDNKSIEISHTEFENNLMKETYIDTITTGKGTFDIYRPYNTLQQIKIGKHTKWCISSIEYKNYFNKYFVHGNARFYLFSRIKSDNEKYQLLIFLDNRKEVWNTLNKEIGCDEFKKLTDIDCKNYNWYPINQYVKDITVYDKLGNKIGHVINNKKEGEWIEYDDNGNIQSKQYYKNGKPEGEFIEKNKNGNIESIKHYKNGKLNGEYLEYYDNNKIHIKKYYKNDKLDGNYISYYENGNVWHKGYYKDDKLDKEFITYYENKKLELQCYYRNGQKNGEYKEYYNSGKIKMETNYINDKLNGEYKEYYKDGKINIEANYIDGILNGKYKICDISNRCEISYYRNGIELNNL